PAIFPDPQAAVSRGLGQERSVLPAPRRRGVQARHPERDRALLRHGSFRFGDACDGDRSGDTRLSSTLTSLRGEIGMETSVAIVTGASQGIGRATAIRLARDFSALVLAARGLANLEQTAEAVKAAGAKALVIDLDLSQPASAQSVVD